MANIFLKSGEDTNSVQEEFNALRASSRDKKKHNKNNSMEAENNSKKVLIVGVLCLLIGFGAGFLVFSDNSVLDGGADDEVVLEEKVLNDNDADTNSENDAEPVVVSGVTLVVGDQNFGDTVFVDNITLDRTSWIVVYEDNQGTAGSILGAQLYDTGAYEEIEVSLLRGTTPEAKYYVKIHADDGDRQFDFRRDVAVVDGDGVEVVANFMTGSGTPR